MLAIVMEILRHLTGLKPLLDHFIKNRADADQAQQAALADMRALLRAERSDLTESQTSLNTQLQNQALQIADLAEDLRRARSALESAQIRADATELQITRLTTILRNTAIAFTILLLALLALAAEILHLLHTR